MAFGRTALRQTILPQTMLPQSMMRRCFYERQCDLAKRRQWGWWLGPGGIRRSAGWAEIPGIAPSEAFEVKCRSESGGGRVGWPAFPSPQDALPWRLENSADSRKKPSA